MWFSGAGFNNETGESGVGNSSHFTSLAGAGVSLSFFGECPSGSFVKLSLRFNFVVEGTGITLLGSSNCSYEVTLDNTLQTIGSPPENALFAEDGLADTLHSISLQVLTTSKTQALAFQGAVVYSLVNSSYAQ